MPFDPRQPPSDIGEAEKDAGYPVFRIALTLKSPSSINTSGTGGEKHISVTHLSPDQVHDEVKGRQTRARVGFLPQAYYSFAVERLNRDRPQS